MINVVFLSSYFGIKFNCGNINTPGGGGLLRLRQSAGEMEACDCGVGLRKRRRTTEEEETCVGGGGLQRRRRLTEREDC